MKTIILAGGLGTRLAEKTVEIPKPMVPINNLPILHHIMQIYSSFNYNEFVLALGYKPHIIRDYFVNYYTLYNDLSVELSSGNVSVQGNHRLPWQIHMVDTGLMTATGGRLKRLQKWIGSNRFMMTYGDGLCDVKIDDLVEFHKSHGKLATVTSVRPPARFGLLNFEGEQITSFKEKPQTDDGWINGGFFVLEPEVLEYISGDDTSWEQEPLSRLAAAGELMGFKHKGFWHPMDTLREVRYLNELCASGNAPWIVKHKQMVS